MNTNTIEILQQIADNTQHLKHLEIIHALIILLLTGILTGIIAWANRK